MTTTLLDEILLWSESSLPGWQQDAVRRLFQKQKLDEKDYDELYALMKIEYGIPDSNDRQPIPFGSEHIPIQTENSSAIILKEMQNLKYVNRIANGQSIIFSSTGITVIYGANGSGKSGYSRVLKRACRSRDSSEVIYPNANNENENNCIPEATFKVAVNGKDVDPLLWRHDETSPEILSTISVFDGKCARVYLDAEQEAEFIPYGLDIIQNLADVVLPKLTQMLAKEIETVEIDKKPFEDLAIETEVGKLISSLSEKTDPNKINKLGTLDKVNTARLDELKNILSGDPIKKADDLDLKAKRIEGLIERINKALSNVNHEIIEKLKKSDFELETAQKAEKIAAEIFQSDDNFLPGTGEKAWKQLFDAARQYSITIAYPDKTFPNTETGGKCPLCQQLLGKEASGRLHSFEEHLKQDSAQVAAKLRKIHKNNIDGFNNGSVAFGMDEALINELEQLDGELFKNIRALEESTAHKKEWISIALESHDWEQPLPALDEKPLKTLEERAKYFSAQALESRKAANKEQRTILKTEYSELHARVELSLRLEGVLNLHQRFRRKAMLEECKKGLRTNSISIKAKEFASKTVTEALRDSLNKEYETLGVGHINVELSERIVKAKPKHKLVLNLPVKRSLKDILSDGEQRIIAIGSFLAELNLADHKGGIVFDDPVSSLDHHWRINVARRLVSEATVRQVIVFTHDTVFLNELQTSIEKMNIDSKIYFLEWQEHPGHVKEGLPWEHKSYKDRIDKHEKEQRLLAKAWPTYPNEDDREKIRKQYNYLRATIERVVQDVLFNGVVQRYRDWIRVEKLSDVAGLTQDECGEINRIHKECCKVVDAHDPASAKNSPVPDPKQLLADINTLKMVIDGIKARRNPKSNQNPSS